jgi:hypothetical protein
MESGGGIVSGADGNRYTFGRSDWRGPTPPTAGTEVDFIAATNTASEVFPLPSRATASTTTVAPGAAVVINPASNEGSSQLLGVLGILLLLLGFIIPFVPTVAALIVGLIGASSAKRYKNESGLVLSRIAWIGAVILLVVGIVLFAMVAVFAWPLIDIFLQYIWHVFREEQAARTALLFL